MEGDSIETKTRQEYVDIIVRLKSAAREVADAGLWATYHILDDALTKIGWEVAERLGGKKQEKSLTDQVYPYQLHKKE